MSGDFISTYNLLNAPRSGARKAQAEIARLGKEAVELRHADVGLVLGSKTGYAAILHQEADSIEKMVSSNGLAAGRLDVTYSIINDIRGMADKMMATLVGLPSNPTSAGIIHSDAQRNLRTLIEKLNSSFANGRLFGGIRTDQAPMQDASGLVVTAFDAYVAGLPSPSVQEMSAAELDVFLKAEFETQFETDWKTNWSTASDINLSSQISATETIEISVNSNAAPFRKLAKAFAALGTLSSHEMNEDTFKAAISYAIGQLGEALSGLEIMQGTIGSAQGHIKATNEGLKKQSKLLKDNLFILEGIDPADAKVKSDAFELQLSIAYSLTARLQKLNLLNYL